MKKIFLVIMFVLLTSGCINIGNASLDTIVSTTINSKYKLYNHVNSGYKYYLPRTLKSVVTDEYNEVIKSKYNDYYLYVDQVAYHNKKASSYQEDETLYYSKVIMVKDELKGLINIKDVGQEYLIKIIYNYAKIEAKCSHNDLNVVVADALTILSSITYIDDVIASNLSKNDFSSVEEQVNIFPENSNDINYLDEVDDTYTGNEDDYDPNVIKERR